MRYSFRTGSEDSGETRQDTYVALQSALEDQLFSHGDVDEGGATKVERCSGRRRKESQKKGFARAAGSSAKPTGSLGLKPGSAEIGIFFVWAEN